MWTKIEKQDLLFNISLTPLPYLFFTVLIEFYNFKFWELNSLSMNRVNYGRKSEKT